MFHLVREVGEFRILAENQGNSIVINEFKNGKIWKILHLKISTKKSPCSLSLYSIYLVKKKLLKNWKKNWNCLCNCNWKTETVYVTEAVYVTKNSKSKKKKYGTVIKLKLNRQRLRSTDSVSKYLSIKIDENFNWKHHTISTKLNRANAVLFKIKN